VQTSADIVSSQDMIFGLVATDIGREGIRAKDGVGSVREIEQALMRAVNAHRNQSAGSNDCRRQRSDAALRHNSVFVYGGWLVNAKAEFDLVTVCLRKKECSRSSIVSVL